MATLALFVRHSNIFNCISCHSASRKLYWERVSSSSLLGEKLHNDFKIWSACHDDFAEANCFKFAIARVSISSRPEKFVAPAFSPKLFIDSTIAQGVTGTLRFNQA